MRRPIIPPGFVQSGHEPAAQQASATSVDRSTQTTPKPALSSSPTKKDSGTLAKLMNQLPAAAASSKKEIVVTSFQDESEGFALQGQTFADAAALAKHVALHAPMSDNAAELQSQLKDTRLLMNNPAESEISDILGRRGIIFQTKSQFAPSRKSAPVATKDEGFLKLIAAGVAGQRAVVVTSSKTLDLIGHTYASAAELAQFAIKHGPGENGQLVRDNRDLKLLEDNPSNAFKILANRGIIYTTRRALDADLQNASAYAVTVTSAAGHRPELKLGGMQFASLLELGGFVLDNFDSLSVAIPQKKRDLKATLLRTIQSNDDKDLKDFLSSVLITFKPDILAQNQTAETAARMPDERQIVLTKVSATHTAAVPVTPAIPLESARQLVPADVMDAATPASTKAETSPAVLAILSYHRDENIRFEVGRSLYTLIPDLIRLSDDRNPAVRRAVASNRKIIPVPGNEHAVALTEVMMRLVKDKDVGVRRGLGNNPETPEAVMELLSVDPSPYVKGDAGGHANTAIPTLSRLAKNREVCVRRDVAHNERTLEDDLAMLSTDKSPIVSDMAKRNPKTPVVSGA